MQCTRIFVLHAADVIRLCSYKRNNTLFKYSTAVDRSAANYCLDTVRQFDHENFMCTLLLPSSYRASAFAIRAFNIEVARVQNLVSDSRIGLIRMKFWEDTIEKIYADNVPQHPVAIELHSAFKRHKLTKRFLKRLITVRSSQLTCPSFPDLDAVELYCEASVASVYYLLLESAEGLYDRGEEVRSDLKSKQAIWLSPSIVPALAQSAVQWGTTHPGLQNVHADHAASHLGKAQGILNFIRAVPHNATRRTVTLPQDVLTRHAISHEDLFRARVSKSLQDAMLDVANRAKQHLDKARSLNKLVPKEAFTLLLPAVAVGSYLDRLQTVDFDVFHPRLRQRDALLPLRLYWNKFVSNY